MDVITIPDATDEPQAYVEALLKLVGDRDIIEIFSATRARLFGLVEGLSEEQAWQRPDENEWSVAELLGHLFDVELVHGFRWRLLLTDDNPSYPGYNDKRWAQLPKPPIPELLVAWKGLRDANLVLLKSIKPDEWPRMGVHSEQGPESLERSVRKLAAHDMAHLNQLERILAAVKQ